MLGFLSFVGATKERNFTLYGRGRWYFEMFVKYQKQGTRSFSVFTEFCFIQRQSRQPAQGYFILSFSKFFQGGVDGLDIAFEVSWSLYVGVSQVLIGVSKERRESFGMRSFERKRKIWFSATSATSAVCVVQPIVNFQMNFQFDEQ